MIKIRLHDRPVELVVNIDEDMPRILYGDEIRLKQVLILFILFQGILMYAPAMR